MRVRLVKKQSIEDYVRRHASSRASFDTFTTYIKGADWGNPLDMVETFGAKATDIFGKNSQTDQMVDRVCLNIGGNNYRIICKYRFGEKRVTLFICWIGTHQQYSAMCKRNKQYEINIY